MSFPAVLSVNACCCCSLGCTDQAESRRLQQQLAEAKRANASLEERAFVAENKNSDEVLEATEAAKEVIDGKNEEIRVLRMMLEAAKIDARTKERERNALQKKLQSPKR